MQALWNISNEYKNRAAIIEQGGISHTYEQLSHDILSLSQKLSRSQKQLVLVLAKNNYQSLLGYLSVLHNQDAVMLINAELEKQLLITIIEHYKPAYIIGDFHHEEYSIVEEGILKRNDNLEYEIHPDLALLLSTSGTTGSVKFVRLSFENLLSNAKSIAEYLQITKNERGLANLPMHYSYGLSIINSHLYAGATILLTSESVLTKDFWEFVKTERATSLAGVPYTYQMMRRIGFHRMDLPHLRYFSQAGGRLSEKYVRFFGEYAKEYGKQFFVMYGQTEAAPRMSYLAPDKVFEKPSSIGKAIPDGKLRIDPETSELVYEGPNVMLGYAQKYCDLAKGDELQGVLHTGDIAEMDKEGFFYIKGRMKRFIKLLGLRLNLDNVEKQIETSIGVSSVCVGTDDKMIVVIEDEQYKDKIQELIEHTYKLHHTYFRVKIIEDIPRLSNGKINYEATKDLVL